MAAGKTAVGRALSRRLGVPFIDLDISLERREGRSITEIFASCGEGGFRDLESYELDRVIEVEPAVVALGGGTLLRDSNRRKVRAAGTVVWLDTPRSTILSRLNEGGGDRPLAADPERVAELFEQRRESYRSCDLRLRPRDGESPEEIAARIAESLSQLESPQ